MWSTDPQSLLAKKNVVDVLGLWLLGKFLGIYILYSKILNNGISDVLFTDKKI